MSAAGIATLDGWVVWRLTLAAVLRGVSDRVLGALWWILDPLLLLGVYALVFDGFLGFGRHPDQRAYPLFVACALIPWRWFTLATTQGASAFSRNATVLSSIPVDREAVLLSEWIAASAQALAGVAVLLAAMLVYRCPITWNLLWLLPPLAVLAALGLGVGYLLCPLFVMLPDLRDFYTALLRLGWFLSPGLYPLARVPESVRGIYAAANPFVGILEGLRRPIHAGLPPEWTALAWSALWAVALLAIGRFVFRRLANDAVRML